MTPLSAMLQTENPMAVMLQTFIDLGLPMVKGPRADIRLYGRSRGYDGRKLQDRGELPETGFVNKGPGVAGRRFRMPLQIEKFDIIFPNHVPSSASVREMVMTWAESQQ